MAVSGVVDSRGSTSRRDCTEPSCGVHCVGESGRKIGRTQGPG